MANIKQIRGSLFESRCQTIVNTVNCVGVMGKGIAFEFRHRYPEMFKSYKQMCARNGLRPGLLQLWTKSDPWILNFPTKNHWKYPSKLEYIENGLKKFTETYRERGITSVAFPQLGSSSGGLDWDDVKAVMLKHLEPLPNIEVEIYLFDPAAKDDVYERLRRTIRHFNTGDYKSRLGIPPKQALLIQDAIENSTVHSMRDLTELNGVGKKALEKLYATATTPDTVTTGHERQTNIFAG